MTAARHGALDTRVMTWLRRSLIVITVVALPMVVFDVGGPVRAVLALIVLLVGPGLAASLRMGDMSIEFRALISLTVSAAVLTVLATVMALFEWWSSTWAFVIVAVAAVAVTSFPSATGSIGATSGEAPRVDIGPRSRGRDDERGGDGDD